MTSDYLYYWLSSAKPIAEELASGTTFLEISGAKAAQIPCPVAPIAEQTRIVEKLEELLSDLDAGVAELKAAQKKLTQYRQSLLKAAVEGRLTAQWRADRARRGEPTETGAQLLQRILQERRTRWETQQRAKFAAQGKTPPQGWQKKYPEPVKPDTTDLPELPEGWVWASVDQLSPDDIANGRSVPTAEMGAKVLRLTAIRNGTIDLTATKYGAWTKEDAKPYAVCKGDLLIVRGNGSLSLVARAGLVPEIYEQIAYPDTLIRLRVIEHIVQPAWLALIWNNGATRNHFETRARTSAGIYKISQPDIISLVIPIPPIDEQHEILTKVTISDQFSDNLSTTLEIAIQQAAAQRKNILRAAFSGQLVPQDPSDEPASQLLARIRAERSAHSSEKNPRGRKRKTEITV